MSVRNAYPPTKLTLDKINLDSKSLIDLGIQFNKTLNYLPLCPIDREPGARVRSLDTYSENLQTTYTQFVIGVRHNDQLALDAAVSAALSAQKERETMIQELIELGVPQEVCEDAEETYLLGGLPQLLTQCFNPSFETVKRDASLVQEVAVAITAVYESIATSSLAPDAVAHSMGQLIGELCKMAPHSSLTALVTEHFKNNRYETVAQITSLLSQDELAILQCLRDGVFKSASLAPPLHNVQRVSVEEFSQDPGTEGLKEA